MDKKQKKIAANLVVPSSLLEDQFFSVIEKILQGLESQFFYVYGEQTWYTKNKIKAIQKKTQSFYDLNSIAFCEKLCEDLSPEEYYSAQRLLFFLDKKRRAKIINHLEGEFPKKQFVKKVVRLNLYKDVLKSSFKEAKVEILRHLLFKYSFDKTYAPAVYSIEKSLAFVFSQKLKPVVDSMSGEIMSYLLNDLIKFKYEKKRYSYFIGNFKNLPRWMKANKGFAELLVLQMAENSFDFPLESMCFLISKSKNKKIINLFYKRLVEMEEYEKFNDILKKTGVTPTSVRMSDILGGTSA